MFIQTKATPNPAIMEFYPGHTVMESGTVEFADAEGAKCSPLAARLLAIEQVAGVFFGTDVITVTKSDGAEWDVLKPAILGVIMEHFLEGGPILWQAGPRAESETSPKDRETIARIKELLDTRIGPTVAEEGVELAFHNYEDAVLSLEIAGSSLSIPLFALKIRIENTLFSGVPEIAEIRFLRKRREPVSDSPGLSSTEGLAVQRVLDEEINPGVALHGGHIALIDVQDDTAYIRLEGGCQGCGMADVTLKQGVEGAIKEAVPEIATVLDVTDHAEGTNPYYQPGKGGMSPF